LTIVALAPLIGCSGSHSPTNITNPEAGKIRLDVTGSAACGIVYWSIGPKDNYPDGTETTFPWRWIEPASPGDVVELEARNCCGGTCANPPCSIALTATVRWEGARLATATTTDVLTPSCTPASYIAVSVP
jgi:hypothetical protein